MGDPGGLSVRLIDPSVSSKEAFHHSDGFLSNSMLDPANAVFGHAHVLMEELPSLWQNLSPSSKGDAIECHFVK